MFPSKIFLHAICTNVVLRQFYYLRVFRNITMYISLVITVLRAVESVQLECEFSKNNNPTNNF